MSHLLIGTVHVSEADDDCYQNTIARTARDCTMVLMPVTCQGHTTTKKSFNRNVDKQTHKRSK